MKCAHCLTEFHATSETQVLGEDADSAWGINVMRCPACNRFNIFLFDCVLYSDRRSIRAMKSQRLIRPKGSNRPPAPSEVPKEIAEDYSEACLVLPDSPKASAALS